MRRPGIEAGARCHSHGAPRAHQNFEKADRLGAIVLLRKLGRFAEFGEQCLRASGVQPGRRANQPLVHVGCSLEQRMEPHVDHEDGH
ncbi:hypothetical protein ASF34_19265 [Methylobacterium sp. Leaf106]|nr:hypothetical protein ASF34_19265 [Methylobacterium sp. Leaf106]